MFRFIMLAILVFMHSDFALAFASDIPEQAPWYVAMLQSVLGAFPEINAAFAVVMTFLMGLLRLLSEFLLWLHKKTETTLDDKAYAYTSIGLKWLGAIFGWFGLGKSKKLD